jgi:hypothetical protein
MHFPGAHPKAGDKTAKTRQNATKRDTQDSNSRKTVKFGKEMVKSLSAGAAAGLSDAKPYQNSTTRKSASPRSRNGPVFPPARSCGGQIALGLSWGPVFRSGGKHLDHDAALPAWLWARKWECPGSFLPLPRLITDHS